MKYKIGDIIKARIDGHGNVISTDPIYPFYGIKTKTGLKFIHETELTMVWKKQTAL